MDRTGSEGAPSGGDHRLATYGTLAPSRPNHHQLDGLRGRWFAGHVRGRLLEVGWGAAFGYPALVPTADGDVDAAICVHRREPEPPIGRRGER